MEEERRILDDRGGAAKSAIIRDILREMNKNMVDLTELLSPSG